MITILPICRVVSNSRPHDLKLYLWVCENDIDEKLLMLRIPAGNFSYEELIFENLAAHTGIEPVLSALRGRRVNQLHHDARTKENLSIAIDKL